MTLWIRFEDKDALMWLQEMMENMVERADRDPIRYCDHYQNIITSAKSVNDYFTSTEVLETLKKTSAAKPKTKQPAKSDVLALCKTHNTYQARQRPRTECESCWDAYKKFNPMKYAKARRDFERSQKK